MPTHTSLHITFYTTPVSPITVDKLTPATLIKTKAGSPKEDMNINHPVVTLKYDSSLLNANMAYIQEFGKYYFVHPPTLQTGERMVFTMDVDVLMTYKNQIKNCDAVVIRSESVGLNNVPDKQLPIDPNSVDIVSVLGTKGFDKMSIGKDTHGNNIVSLQYVLITGRGKEATQQGGNNS